MKLAVPYVQDTPERESSSFVPEGVEEAVERREGRGRRVKREKTKLESAKKGPTTKKENGHSIDDVCRNLSGNFFFEFYVLFLKILG